MQRKLLKFSVWLLLCIIAIGFGYGIYSYLKIPLDYIPFFVIYCIAMILYITYKVDTKYDGVHKMIEDDKKPISFTPEEKEKILMLMDTEKNVTIKQNNSVEINNKKVNV